MATLREMIDFILELQVLDCDDGGHAHHWSRDINPFAFRERDADGWAECARLQNFISEIAARMHFGHDAYFGDLWRGFAVARRLLETYDDFDPDPRDAGDVIDWLATVWDSNPATLFRDLRQAFPAIVAAHLGKILSDLDEHLQGRLWEQAYNAMDADGRVHRQGIDLRADALNAACRTHEPGAFPEDFRAHWAEHAAAGHIVAAYQLQALSRATNAA